MSRGGIVSPFVAGAVVARRYRLLRLTGAGAMGVVWRAKDERTNMDVALKLLVRPDLDLRARLLREAGSICALSHENVIQVHDIGETGSGDPFIVTELVEADTLAVELARRGKLEPQEAASIGRDIARALAAAHARGIVHRDLKPSNVFVLPVPGRSAPLVKVGDFGLGESVVPVAPAPGAESASGGVTVYLSPEQALPGAFIDGRSDIWSLGAVLFEVLSGAPLFSGDEEEVLSRVVSGPIPLLWHRVRNIHPGLSGLVMACLRRDREERPFPATEVARRLDHFASPPRTSSWAPPPSAARRAESRSEPPAPRPVALRPRPRQAIAPPPMGPGDAVESPGPIAVRLNRASSPEVGSAARAAPLRAPMEAISEANEDTDSALQATLPSAQSPYSKPGDLPRSGPDSGVVPVRPWRAFLAGALPEGRASRWVIGATLIAALLFFALVVYTAMVGDPAEEGRPFTDVAGPGEPLRFPPPNR